MFAQAEIFHDMLDCLWHGNHILAQQKATVEHFACHWRLQSWMRVKSGQSRPVV
jgi:hypothetical protein